MLDRGWGRTLYRLKCPVPPVVARWFVAANDGSHGRQDDEEHGTCALRPGQNIVTAAMLHYVSLLGLRIMIIIDRRARAKRWTQAI
jgi:hypothetical protein